MQGCTGRRTSAPVLPTAEAIDFREPQKDKPPWFPPNCQPNIPNLVILFSPRRCWFSHCIGRLSQRNFSHLRCRTICRTYLEKVRPKTVSEISWFLRWIRAGCRCKGSESCWEAGRGSMLANIWDLIKPKVIQFLPDTSLAEGFFKKPVETSIVTTWKM